MSTIKTLKERLKVLDPDVQFRIYCWVWFLRTCNIRKYLDSIHTHLFQWVLGSAHQIQDVRVGAQEIRDEQSQRS